METETQPLYKALAISELRTLIPSIEQISPPNRPISKHEFVQIINQLAHFKPIDGYSYDHVAERLLIFKRDV